MFEYGFKPAAKALTIESELLPDPNRSTMQDILATIDMKDRPKGGRFMTTLDEVEEAL